METINKVLDKDSKSTLISQLKESDTTIENRQEILETLNEHFVTVGPNHARKIERKQNDNPLQFLKRANPQENVKFSMVDQETMLKAIKQLKNGKAAGPDKIPTTLVKDAAEFISQPLMMIFYASLKLGVFPDIWKLAKVSPIFKTGARNNKNNYRPISVLSIFSKLIEKIVHDQLLAFMQLYKILIPNQFAFKKLHSTITSLINVSDYWYENMNDKKVNIALFLDLKKAFDTGDHEILISKLESYGVHGDVNKWFVSYLSDRYQYCSFNGCRSTAKRVTC